MWDAPCRADPGQKPDLPRVAVTAGVESDRNEHLDFVDGARGLAALVVAVGHMINISPYFSAPYGAAFRLVSSRQLLFWPFRHGSEMVGLFLLVSGFSLAHAEIGRRARGGVASRLGLFAARRAWRIGPVYYSALALGLVLVNLPFGLRDLPGEFSASFPITWQGTGAHIALVQNLRPSEWALQGNGPLWTIAYEGQLYLLFPILLWMIIRLQARMRWVFLSAGIVAASFLPSEGAFLAQAFLLGIALAVNMQTIRRVRTSILVIIGLLLLSIGVLDLRTVLLHPPMYTIIWLGGFAALLVASMRSPSSRKNPLNASILRWLGVRSYSLYAFHFPLVYVVFAAGTDVGLRGGALAIATLTVGLPLSIAAAALGFRWVERPSLRRARRSGGGRRRAAGITETTVARQQNLPRTT